MIKQVWQWITNRFSSPAAILQGSCNQCGQCCRNLLLYDGNRVIRDQEQFQQLLVRQPGYEIYEPVYHDEQGGQLYFSCRHIGSDNRCHNYEERPAICRDYPNPAMFRHGARLPEQCSYKLTPQHQFASHLQQQRHRLRQR